MTERSHPKLAFAILLASLLPTGVLAVDGTRLIDQARALAGNATPGDAPGFPVTISQPGSYRLSGNLTVPNADTTAIEITADAVTLDLNGFAILGPVTCSGIPPTCTGTGSGHGISADIDQNSISISNGKVRGMGDNGVFLAGIGLTVKDLQVSRNGGFGMSIGYAAVVSGNSAWGNGFHGMLVQAGTVTGNSASRNGSTGIFIAGTGTATGNTVTSNGGCGIHVNAGMASGNTASQNDTGLCLGPAVGYLGNVITDNGSHVTGGVNLGQNLCGSYIGGGMLCP